jgi:Fe-S oxidoreductase
MSWTAWPSPAGAAFAMLFAKLSPKALIAIAHVGFWTHSSLVLVFLNLLPHSKHFHVITGIPNVFFQNLEPAGRLMPMAENAEKLMELVGAAAEASDPRALPIGAARIEHFSWKAILDFYTCTECGRCSDNCPAHRTGKVLSPKHLTLALRDHLYEREDEFIEARHALAKVAKHAPSAEGEAVPAAAGLGVTSHVKAINIDEFIHPDVVWACTSCRACEEQCPVMISYVDKIVDIRRNLVLVKGEFPAQLAKPFQGMEVNGNPWSLSRMDRAAWSDGLGVTMMADKPDAQVLFWVGCAASYDDRAKKIARATAKLLKQANVDFAILGQEENCTGDPARRAGNEFLFAMLAEGNAATLNGYKEKGGAKTIITTCPHCFNSLKNEYPDFGAKFEVVHHTDYLLGLVAVGKLNPTKPVDGRVVYHDSCYLGRYNGVYESPREILRRIPGVELVEPEYWNKQRGLCCGAGGAQMFMEEQNHDRVNVKRTLQLIDTKPDTIASACPFCMTMLTDGLKSKNLEEKIQQLDVVELLERSCTEEQAVAQPPPVSERPAPEAAAE